MDAAVNYSATLKRMDESHVTWLQWKIMLISGMGFLTDAYDLFIIGVVMDILMTQWKPSSLEVGLVGSTALIASAIGAVIFGRVADILGRKRIYGYECLVLAIGAIATAFAPNIVWLIIFRFILGVGIGGDYPVSATIMSECAAKKSRGMMVSLVFTMQAAGLIIGPLLAALLLRSDLSPNIVWRVLLGAGAGYFVAVYAMDRIGRKAIQAVGFAVMAIAFVGIALIPDIKRFVEPFLIAYGVSYFFTEFGPNTTTFVYPAEIFPVQVRTTAHGIAAAAGKIGGFVGVFLFPILLHWRGLLSAESAAAIVSILGLLTTVMLLPESKGRSLEELEAD